MGNTYNICVLAKNKKIKKIYQKIREEEVRVIDIVIVRRRDEMG
jgi:hypothetical protein